MDFKLITDQGNPDARALPNRTLTTDEPSLCSLVYDEDQALVRTVIPPLGTGRATVVFEGPEQAQAETQPEPSRSGKQPARISSDVSMKSAG